MAVIQTDNLDNTFKMLKHASSGQIVSRGESGAIRYIERVQAPSLSNQPKTGIVGTRKFAGVRQSNIYAGSEFLEPFIRNPLISATNFYLPQTTLELNAWIRYFDRFHPIVGNAIDMHATVPFSRFELVGITDPHVQRFYEDMADEIELFRRIIEISREYELIGEAFPFAYWSEEMNAFSNITVMNPDYIIIRGIKMLGSEGLRYEMMIDEELRQFVMSQDPLDWEIIQKIDPVLIRAAESGLNAPLDPFNLSHLARLGNPYDVRGTSIVLGCLKDLMYEEQLREAQYAIAGGIVRPREIWKLGIKDEYMPTDSDLMGLRELLRSAEYDPNFAIVSHHGLEVEFIGAERRLLPIHPELDDIENRILTRLYTSKAMTHGEGPTYANASVAMRVLDARYATKRDFLVDWVINHIFTPVALANEFYKPSKRELAFRFRSAQHDRELMVPDFRWLSLVNLIDRTQQIQYVAQLAQGSRMPMKIVCDMLQVDYQDALEWLKKETGTEFDLVFQETRKQKATAEARAKGINEGGGDPSAASGTGGGPGSQNLEKKVEQDSEKDQKESIDDMEQVGKDIERQQQKAQPDQRPPDVGKETKTFGLDPGKKKEEKGIYAGTEYIGRIPKNPVNLLKGFSPRIIKG